MRTLTLIGIILMVLGALILLLQLLVERLPKELHPALVFVYRTDGLTIVIPTGLAVLLSILVSIILRMAQ